MHSWTRWFSFWHPELLLMLILLGGVYFYVAHVANVTSRGTRGVTRAQQVSFISYLMVFYAALGSPINFLAQTQSFAMFEVQTLLATLVLPWLLLSSIPSWFLSVAFQARWVYKAFQGMTHPFVALIVYNALASVLLLPAIFEADLRNNLLHILDQGALMVAAVFLWWPLASPSKDLPALGNGLRLVYILFGTNFMMPIPVLLILAQRPWYDSYGVVTRLTHSHLIADQQLGGILMIAGMILVYGVRAAMTFASYSSQRWYE